MVVVTLVNPGQRAPDLTGSGSVAVCSGIGRGKRPGASGEGEVVQRCEDHHGVQLARRRRLVARSASSDSLRATATRSYSGDVSAAST